MSEISKKLLLKFATSLTIVSVISIMLINAKGSVQLKNLSEKNKKNEDISVLREIPDQTDQIYINEDQTTFENQENIDPQEQNTYKSINKINEDENIYQTPNNNINSSNQIIKPNNNSNINNNQNGNINIDNNQNQTDNFGQDNIGSSNLKNLKVKINGSIKTFTPLDIVSQIVAGEIGPSFHNDNFGQDNIGSSNLKNLKVKINGSIKTFTPLDIVSQIVAGEIGPSFHKEAIKAQAVAAHSYIRYNNDKGIVPSVVTRNPDSKIKNAVASVINKLVYYKGSIANTVYHATSGGRTNSSAEVWGGNIPYLVSVDSEYDDGNRFSGAKNWGEKVTLSRDKVKSLVEKNTSVRLIDGDEKNWFKLSSTNPFTSGGYVNSIYIGGQAFTGRNVRENILIDGSKWLLKSAKFDFKYDGANFIFTTYGYGHGVGMSQNGANGYATHKGFTYEQILKHYYTGVQIK